ncbi:hypothetical protein ACQ5SO_09145 [Rhodovulum sp. DZ06]|uniref:hypothetical protein n=1 Tax=Rhodovulum sp. DZ06 TaxID=3425126 RepID=UPI003D358376
MTQDDRRAPGGTPAPQGPGAGAAAGLAAGWLIAEGAIGYGLLSAGVALAPSEAAALALAVTAPPALVAAVALFARRAAPASPALPRAEAPQADPAKIGRAVQEAVRAALAEERAARQETEAALSARLDAAAAERSRLLARVESLAEGAAPAAMEADAPAPEPAREPAPGITPAPRPEPAPGFAEAPAARISGPAPTPAPEAPRVDPAPGAATDAEPGLPFDAAPAAPAPAPAAPAPRPAARPTETEAPESALTTTMQLSDLAPPPGAIEEETAPEDGADWDSLARALDFPRDADDREGFAALEKAVRDPLVSDLLQAAEDALTQLAQHNVYMEDLSVVPAAPEDWAAFTAGARGPQASAIGGVQDAEAVDTVRALSRHDSIFRDTAQHLMRRYEALLRRVAEEPDGAAQMPRIADTRTGRAYMLSARALGAFD